MIQQQSLSLTWRASKFHSRSVYLTSAVWLFFQVLGSLSYHPCCSPWIVTEVAKFMGYLSLVLEQEDRHFFLVLKKGGQILFLVFEKRGQVLFVGFQKGEQRLFLIFEKGSGNAFFATNNSWKSRYAMIFKGWGWGWGGLRLFLKLKI